MSEAFTMQCMKPDQVAYLAQPKMMSASPKGELRGINRNQVIQLFLEQDVLWGKSNSEKCGVIPWEPAMGVNT